MFVVDFIRSVLQRRFAPEVPNDNYGRLVAGVIEAVMESLPTTAKWVEAYSEADTATLKEVSATLA